LSSRDALFALSLHAKWRHSFFTLRAGGFVKKRGEEGEEGHYDVREGRGYRGGLDEESGESTGGDGEAEGGRTGREGSERTGAVTEKSSNRCKNGKEEISFATRASTVDSLPAVALDAALPTAPVAALSTLAAAEVAVASAPTTLDVPVPAAATAADVASPTREVALAQEKSATKCQGRKS
jgi:hypothetical protein